MGAKIEYDMRAEIFNHYQKLSYSFYDDQKVGQLLSRITSDLFDITEAVPISPSNIYPIENVLILAIQCSKPATTNAIIIQNIIISLPLSVFNLVPTNTAIHTRKLQRIPLLKVPWNLLKS